MNRLFNSNKPINKWAFKKVLIANRGEIAIRIIRACRQLGLETVAVYSLADKKALHTQLADQAICIGPADPLKSYLNIPRIIEAAKLMGVQAIHPGYGFLSENANFARVCEKNNLIFIGPSAKIISFLGNKEQARLTMSKAGMPIIKGSLKAITSLEKAKEQALKIGFPLVIKASAGGGGKGLRLVKKKNNFEKKFQLAQQEAKATFNDDHMYLEKYLSHPRHIEVQIIADKTGNVTVIGERDCTIQHNHQKIIEEAPAVVLKEKTRRRMFKICKVAVEKLHYMGLGTIEFLYENDRNFYFMEMNTRVQVEHPVTELTTSLNLIISQFKAAAGEKLSENQPFESGFALECRINALNPGTIIGLHLPGGFGIRVDTAIYQGYYVPPNYDGLIAKIIVFGRKRTFVLHQMENIIDETVIKGIKTNLNLLEQILSEPDMKEQKTDVNWLDQKINFSGEKNEN